VLKFGPIPTRIAGKDAFKETADRQTECKNHTTCRLIIMVAKAERSRTNIPRDDLSLTGSYHFRKIADLTHRPPYSCEKLFKLLTKVHRFFHDRVNCYDAEPQRKVEETFAKY